VVSLLTKEDVAAKARISIRTLDTLIKAKQGPPRTFIGKRARFTEDDTDAWLSSRRESSEPATDETA
jgi:predicted DNA-binding transcriptional regulator AlpA